MCSCLSSICVTLHTLTLLRRIYSRECSPRPWTMFCLGCTVARQPTLFSINVRPAHILNKNRRLNIEREDDSNEEECEDSKGVGVGGNDI